MKYLILNFLFATVSLGSFIMIMANKVPCKENVRIEFMQNPDKNCKLRLKEVNGEKIKSS